MTGLAIITIFGTTLTQATAEGGGSLSERVGGRTALDSRGSGSEREQARYTVARRTVLGARSLHVARSESDPVTYWQHLAQKRLRLWRADSAHKYRVIVALRHKLRGSLPPTKGRSGSRASSVRSIICQVFGSQCSKALSVAWCESRMNVYARNGQYLGLFQEGDYARSRYGFAYNAWTQARSAYRYWRDAGWSPWTCA